MTPLRHDLREKRFGSLTVVEPTQTAAGRSAWLCLCDCGTEAVVSSQNLRNGRTKSCGCYRTVARTKDLQGERFGRLRVRQPAEKQDGVTAWRCTCDCGATVTVKARNLRSGTTKSCGCLKREVAGARLRGHGLSKDAHGRRSRLYNIWAGMKARCLNPNHKSYPEYGGKGVRVCDEWLKYPTFHKWALANGYRDDLSIDRMNPNGNYEPSNCRWADRKQQNRNRAWSHDLTHNGQTKTLTEWAEEVGLNRLTLTQRLQRGWDVSKALTTPVDTRFGSQREKGVAA